MTLATQNNFLYTLLDFTLEGQRFTLVNDTQELVSNGVTYLPAAFKAELLAQPERGLQSTRVVFSNIAIDGAVSELGEMTFDAVQSILGELMTLRRVFRSAPDALLIETPLEVLGVNIATQAITITAGFYNLYQQTLPRKHYDEKTAPGLA